MNLPRWVTRPWWPGVAAGLYVGRLVCEQWPGGWGRALGVTAVSLLLSLWLLHHLTQTSTKTSTWPLWLLFLYVLFPTTSPGVAGSVLALTVITWLQTGSASWPTITKTAVPIILFTASLGLYLATLAPDLLPADNGEFQLIATQLGVAHPPGFPLYTLLAHLMTRLPFADNPAWQVNLLSAITASLTVWLVYATVFRLTTRPFPALIAALTLATATTFWAQATTANIRSLTGLFAALMIYALVRHRQVCQINASNPPTDRFLVLFALSGALGLTHHVSLAFMGLVFVLFLLYIDPPLWRTPRRWIRPFLALLLGLLPLLYLPWRAMAPVRGASPALATLHGFLEHALARGFRGDFFYYLQPTIFDPALLAERFRLMGQVFSFQFAAWLLVGMGLGLLWLLWQDRPLALLLGGSVAIHTVITATYRAPQTVEYMLPSYIPAVICLGVAVGQSWGKPAVSRLVAAGLLVTAVSQGWENYASYALLHRDTTARDYAQNLLAAAPPNTVLLADWHWVTPLWYLQEIEAQRPDVSIQFVYPVAEAYADTWAQRISHELAAGHPVIATHFDENAYRHLPPAELLHDAYLYRQTPRHTLPPDFQPLDVTLGNAIRLSGFAMQPASVEIGQEIILTLAWQVTTPHPATFSLFAHLVGADGGLYAQYDQSAQPQPIGLTLTQFRLTPRPGALPGTFTILVGAYGSIPLPDMAGNERTPITTIQVTAVSHPPITFHPQHRHLIGDPRTLIGYDWDHTLPHQPRLYLHWQLGTHYITEVIDDAQPRQLNWYGPWGMPLSGWPPTDTEQRYVPMGQGIVWTGGKIDLSAVSLEQPVLTVRPTFASDRPVLRDLVTSVRLIGYAADGWQWAWWDLQDGVPALGAIPTLKWVAGSEVTDVHRLHLSPKATPGQLLGGMLRLYEAFTTRPLPILDERISQHYPGIPLPTATLTP